MQSSVLEIFMLEHLTFIRGFKHTIGFLKKRKNCIHKWSETCYERIVFAEYLIIAWITAGEQISVPLFQCSSEMVYRRKEDPNCVHSCKPALWTFCIPLKIDKSENPIVMVTGMEDVYQSVLVSTDVFHKLYIRAE